MSLQHRLQTTLQLLRRAFPDVATTEGAGRAAIIERLEPHVAAIESHAQGIVDELRAGALAQRWLSDPERIASLITALETLAIKRGAVLADVRTLHSLVVDSATPTDQPFWYSALPGQPYGLLRSVPEVRNQLAARGILAWEDDPTESWRLVNTQWLTAHGDIRKHVLDAEAALGRRCRFCQLEEPPVCDQLFPVELERRQGKQVINGVVTIHSGVTHTHEPCRPFWLEWLELASTYPTQEAAEAADAAAGRKPRAAPAQTPVPKLERPMMDAPPREYPTDKLSEYPSSFGGQLPDHPPSGEAEG